IGTSAGSVITGNVAIENSLGISLGDGAMAIAGNAVIGNTYGFGNHGVGPPGGGSNFTGTLEKNNMIGNGCGLYVDSAVGLVADDNYWGASTGPGADPADNFCTSNGGTVTVTSFAKSPFKIKPPINP